MHLDVDIVEHEREVVLCRVISAPRARTWMAEATTGAGARLGTRAETATGSSRPVRHWVHA